MKKDIHCKNCKIIELPTIKDGRGSCLSVAENLRNIPFKIKRVYYIYNLDGKAIRGMHAHKELEQVLFCISGSCLMEVDDGTNMQIITLDEPSVGIYLGPKLWHTMAQFSGNCILLVLASDFYDESDYIRDYPEFRKRK